MEKILKLLQESIKDIKFGTVKFEVIIHEGKITYIEITEIKKKIKI